MLFVTARERDAPDLQRLAAAGGARVQPLALDVTDERSVADALGVVAAATERLDLVIVCAGLLHDGDLRPEKHLAEVDPDHLARSFAVNATGPLLVLKHCRTLLTGGGRSVFASLSARVGSIGDNRLGGWYAYRAAKAAQNQLTRTAAIELRRHSRQAICVGLHPGTVDTDLSRPFQRNLPAGQLQRPADAAARLLAVIEGLTPADSGGVFAWDGQRLPE